MVAKAKPTAVDPRKSATEKPPAQEAAPASKRARASADETVTVIIPAPFKLNLGAGGIVSYDSGTQEMPLSHAMHSYSKDNGVEIYKGK